jgi:LysM repeat protein
MSAFNPIIPPGSPLERAHPRRNPKLVVTVFAILAVHVLLLSGLLIQGCKRDDKNAASNPDTFTNSTAALPPLPAANPPPPVTAPSFSAAPSTQAPAAVYPAPSAPAETMSAPVVATEPSPVLTPKTAETTPSASHAAGSTHSNKAKVATADGPVTVYVVKVGDNLTKIARAHGTTAKAIREASALKTDRILVGQKLKVPTSSTSATGSKDSASVSKPETTAK